MKSTLLSNQGKYRYQAINTIIKYYRDTERKDIGHTIKRPSLLGFTVNLHHSSIFEPATLNINPDSWGGNQNVLVIICAKETPREPLFGGRCRHWDFMGTDPAVLPIGHHLVYSSWYYHTTATRPWNLIQISWIKSKQARVGLWSKTSSLSFCIRLQSRVVEHHI